MAYTYPFDPTTPAGGDPVAQGDDRIRELKNALQERIESFFTGKDIQPWVGKNGAAMGVTIFGTDPGGTEQVRVGGSMRLSGSVIVGGATLSQADATAGRLLIGDGIATNTALRIISGSATVLQIDAVLSNSSATEKTLGFQTNGGLATFGGGVQVTGGGSTAGSISKQAAAGLAIQAVVGSSYDMVLFRPDGATIVMGVPTGSGTMNFGSSIISTITSEVVLGATNGATGRLFGQFANSNVTMLWGVESNTGGSIFLSTAAYSVVFGTPQAKSLHLCTSNTPRLTIDSVGATVMGTDPGGTALLRVGGDGIFSGSVAAGGIAFGSGVLQVIKNSTYTSESTSGIYVRAGLNACALIMGADETNLRAYIQSMQSGTSYTTRPLYIMPNGGSISFFNATAHAQQTASGSRGGNAALASLLTCLANYGLVIDTTTV